MADFVSATRLGCQIVTVTVFYLLTTYNTLDYKITGITEERVNIEQAHSHFTRC